MAKQTPKPMKIFDANSSAKAYFLSNENENPPHKDENARNIKFALKTR